MTTIKSYTDFWQSLKLAEFLSPKSADMHYYVGNKPLTSSENYERASFINDTNIDIPCWSLAALLKIIPKRINNNGLRTYIDENDFSIWYYEFGYSVNNTLPNIKMESAVDACYEMIIGLHERNLL